MGQDGGAERAQTWLMENPQVGQRVWAEKLTGTFTVVAVDGDQRLAELQSTEVNNTRELAVRFLLIHAVGGDHSPISRD